MLLPPWCGLRAQRLGTLHCLAARRTHGVCAGASWTPGARVGPAEEAESSAEGSSPPGKPLPGPNPSGRHQPFTVRWSRAEGRQGAVRSQTRPRVHGKRGVPQGGQGVEAEGLCLEFLGVESPQWPLSGLLQTHGPDPAPSEHGAGPNRLPVSCQVTGQSQAVGPLICQMGTRGPGRPLSPVRALWLGVGSRDSPPQCSPPPSGGSV